MKAAFQLLILLATFLLARAQTVGNGQTWRYQLTDGAAIMNDCPVCDRISIWEPIKGSLDLYLAPNSSQYSITNINFVSTNPFLPATQITGTGIIDYQAAEPILTLDIVVVRSGENAAIRMTNSPSDSSRVFPMIAVQASEDTASISRVYRVRLLAAPIHDLWFSTVANFTSGTGVSISNGDLLSNTGRIVKRNSDLTQFLSIPPGDVGLDAVDVGPRGEIFFSTTSNVESFVNGPITHGDIVTSAGRIYLQTDQLLGAFGVSDPDAGLDGIHYVSEDEIYFSIGKDIPRAGAPTLHRGDILSSNGRIVRTEANLFLAWVNPFNISIGIDAFHVWPNGEIWFSPETDFTATDGRVISAGDLISNQGYIVYRNADILSAFAPVEKNSDFGLDAFVVISDAVASTGNSIILDVTPGDTGIDIHWNTTSARVFQVERARSVGGPWDAISQLLVGQFTFHDDAPGASAFYRIRQW